MFHSRDGGGGEHWHSSGARTHAHTITLTRKRKVEDRLHLIWQGNVQISGGGPLKKTKKKKTTDFWDEESKADTKRKQTPTFIKTVLIHVYTHASKKKTPLTRTYTTIRSYIPSVLSDLKCSDVKKNTCLWHSTEVGKTLIGSFFFSIFSIYIYIFRCILWSTCDRPQGSTQVKW